MTFFEDKYDVLMEHYYRESNPFGSFRLILNCYFAMRSVIKSTNDFCSLIFSKHSPNSNDSSGKYDEEISSNGVEGDGDKKWTTVWVSADPMDNWGLQSYTLIQDSC